MSFQQVSIVQYMVNLQTSFESEFIIDPDKTDDINNDFIQDEIEEFYEDNE